MSNGIERTCWQCGWPSASFEDGVCPACRRQNQEEADAREAAQAEWDSLSERQREARIKWAMR